MTINIPWIIAFCLIIIILLRDLPRKKILKSIKSNLWPCFLALFTISLISALISPHPVTAFTNVILLVAAYVFVSLGFILISQDGFRKILPSILIWSVSIGSFMAVLGYLLNLSWGAMGTGGGAATRGIGGSIDPNNMSLMIIFVLPLLVHRLFHTQKGLMKALTILLIFVNLGGIVSTFSRGGAMVLSVLLILLLIEYARKFRPKYLGWLLLVVMLVFTLLLTLIPKSYWERQGYVTYSSNTDDAFDRRSSYISVGWSAFKENPILGAGPGTFRDIFAGTSYAAHFAPKKYDETAYRRYAHNTYIEYLVGTGILGLFTFLFILWRTLKNFSQACKIFKKQGDIKMASLVASYRLAFISVCIYLFIYSDVHHKYLLISLALSEVAFRFSREIPERELNENTNIGK